MKIGLFFGSFNPIHTGHLIIAQYMVENTDLDRIWFVVSPHNPFKKKSSLAHEQDRLDMVRAAIYDNYQFQACDIEFGLPKPSFTIDTLTYLTEKHPDHEFTLIIGEDNIAHLDKWKNAEILKSNYPFYIYPRPVNDKSGELPIRAKMINAPLIDISATLIRKMIKKEKSIQYLVPQPVEAFIKSKKLYQ